MNTVEILQERNSTFAARRASMDRPLSPSLRTTIIGCLDPRIDPAHILGLTPGEAAVIRNIGGRVTPATLDTLAMLNLISQAADPNPAGERHLIVLHHTECGITRLAKQPEMLGDYFAIEQAELADKAMRVGHR